MPELEAHGVSQEPSELSFDPLAPVDPAVTRETDQWFLDQALEEQRRLREAAQRAASRPSRTRVLGSSGNLRRLALQGKIEYLQNRLNQSEVSEVEGEVVDDKQE
jgi:hypothetical protein